MKLICTMHIKFHTIGSVSCTTSFTLSLSIGVKLASVQVNVQNMNSLEGEREKSIY